MGKRKREGGQIYLFVLILPIILLFVGLAVDLGWISYKKVKIQNSADFSALSAAQYLPQDTSTALNTAYTIFETNYGKLTSIKNVNFYNSNKGIKVHFEEAIPLFFMSLFGINEATIIGKAEAQVQFLSQAAELIPVAIFHNTPLTYGQMTAIYGDDNATRGNFGLVDLSGVGLIGGSTIEHYIGKGYTAADGKMPVAGDRIPTITGKKAGPVHKGFDRRILEKRTTVICPVADFTKISGSGRVPILGFARFEAVSTILTGNGTNEYVEVWGRFIEMVDPNAVTSPNAEYYGVKNIYLVK